MTGSSTTLRAAIRISKTRPLFGCSTGRSLQIRRRATTWHWAFSHFNSPEFTIDQLAGAVHKWTQTLAGKEVAFSTVRRDVEVFVHTYVPTRSARGAVVEDSIGCPLVELGLLEASSDAKSFGFRRGSQDDLPDGILIYATLRYWDGVEGSPSSLSVSDLARQPGTPGRLFKIDESSLISRYEQAEELTDGYLTYNETAGLRQLLPGYQAPQAEPPRLPGIGLSESSSGRESLMKDGTPLHQIVTVNARFSRSVSLVRDFESPDALNGYILTPIGRDVLGRLQSALRGDSATRAWSLTGAYGSGKSAFALCVAQLLGRRAEDLRAGQGLPEEAGRETLGRPVRSRRPMSPTDRSGSSQCS